jgi:hypothetical protein
MVRIKTILIAVLVVILGILAATYLLESEEKKVKKQFDLLSKWVSKDLGESPITMASKAKNIGTLFAENCELKVPVDSTSATYTPAEVSGYALHGRLQFSEMSLKFYDLTVEFPEKGTAQVVLTANLKGRSMNGELIDETLEVQCVLNKIDQKWLFSAFEVVEVLEK